MRVYLAGPMRGIPDYNFPAFHDAAEELRAIEWQVYSPAERDENDPEIPDNSVLEELGHDWLGTHDLAYFMAFDLQAVCAAEAVVMLDGWEKSQGARLEALTAAEVGHPVFRYDDVKRMIDAETTTFEAIDVEYIRWVFFRKGTPPPTTIPGESAARKALPVVTGVIDYFPAALTAVAAVSRYGNDKHNPGEPLHWSRGKSTDHADAIGRHLIDRGHVDPDTGQRHTAELAWRALALLQMELEAAGEAPMARGAK